MTWQHAAALAASVVADKMGELVTVTSTNGGLSATAQAVLTRAYREITPMGTIEQDPMLIIPQSSIVFAPQPGDMVTGVDGNRYQVERCEAIEAAYQCQLIDIDDE